jgi:electron transfer flavoprotein alpha subunit
MRVLVFIEQREGQVKSSSLEAITVARNLAGNAANVAGIVIGNASEAKLAEFKGYGVDKIFSTDSDALNLYNVLTYAQALEQAIKQFEPNLVLGMASPLGRDLFPRMAARFGGGILTDLIDIKVDGSHIAGVKPMYAGKCLAEVALQNCKIQFATLRPNVFKAQISDDGAATVEPLSVSIDSSNKLKTTEIQLGKTNKADLTEATIIISGGRSLGSKENFKVLESCAEVLGATVGASRAAVDSGYASHDMQVGQTGKTVNPNLYIACGISGSIQHMAGMRTSKTIVAINTDEEAPIFSIADYGIVADLFQAVPAMQKKLQEMLEK